MNAENLEPKSLQEAIKYFSDPQVCHDFIVAMRWGNEPVCARCGSVEVGEIRTRRMFKCKSCQKQFSVKVGTIFEDSPIGLDKWICAMWMLANCKNGVSSCEIARELGVTQKTAWFMLQRIRYAMHHETLEKMSGTVEVDETYIGGKAANMHKHKRHGKTGMVGKVAVMGLLERNGKVRTVMIAEAKKKIMDAVVREHVEPGSEVYTDGHAGYSALVDEYIHRFVDHAECYVQGAVHTNTLENFWSLLKRGLKGTYISVEPFHLWRYLDEQAFRYNTRKLSNAERFLLLFGQITGKRLTYATLIGEPVTAQ